MYMYTYIYIYIIIPLRREVTTIHDIHDGLIHASGLIPGTQLQFAPLPLHGRGQKLSWMKMEQIQSDRLKKSLETQRWVYTRPTQ